jgi:hypothetical protein
MMNRIIMGMAFFAFMAFVGYYVGGQSWNGKVLISMGDITDSSRIPAAIRKDLDFSHLDGAELITATQQRLVSAARVVLDPKNQGDLGIELGHFVTRAQDGQRKLACDSYYNRLTLRFEAVGVAEGGEKPLMQIDGPCLTSLTDITSIEPIWIPVQKILKEHPADMDLSYDQNVKFKFESMGTSWPTHWNLQTVRLYNSEEADHEVSISNAELRNIRKQPFLVNWTVLKADASPSPSADGSK